MSRTEEVKDKRDQKNKYMAKQACEAYPDVLPKVKDAKGHISKPKVTLENVRKLLDAIHIEHGTKQRTTNRPTTIATTSSTTIHNS
eukprot:954321-Prymnesium_polylepis.1